MRAVLRAEGETEIDVTQQVKVMYDTCVQSLDWGSGFLDAYEEAAILEVGHHFGWATPKEWEKAVKALERHKAKQRIEADHKDTTEPEPIATNQK